ncbi:MAG TPA: response regulator [Gemmatimonadales bacterium]|nr:response regulator [Gemmatimonadales bacterium]
MKSRTILVAEDESIIRLGLKRILEEAGHTVYAAENGAEAVRLAERCTPDLAVLDIKMPEMDGLEAARALLERAPVPVIFLTAYGEQELIERAARLPVMGYLIKPIKEAELLAMIEVAAQRFEEQRRTARAAADLESEAAERRTVDRAKGLLMQRDGISELEAYGRLQERARAERRTLLEAAQETIEAAARRAE